MAAEHVATSEPALDVDGASGAYGLRLVGVAGARHLLVKGDDHWPRLRLVSSVRSSRPIQEEVTDARASLNLKTGGHLSIDRARGIAHFVVRRRLTDEELIHPYLAPAAAVMAHWLRRQCFHAGAFVSGGGAWALAGDREAGKSSLLAWLALRGHPVVTDDITVIDDMHAFAGPRSIDLRSETAVRFGVGRELGVVGARARWRLGLPEIASSLPFRGWIFLSWGDALEAEALGASERLVRLLRQRTLRLVPTDPAAHLPLAALPAWELRRPRDWEVVDAVGERLLELTAAS